MSPRFVPTLASFGYAAALLVTATASPANTFGSFFTKTSFGTSGYVEVPSSPELNPPDALTVELMYFALGPVAPDDCRSLVGKDFGTAWLLGICSDGSGRWVLRSYLKGGSASLRIGGVLPVQHWAHIAVTFDGHKRRHYIDGEMVAEFAETGPLPASGAALRIFSDEDFEHSPDGWIREVRIWKVARSAAQLRSTINRNLTTPQPGLVAVWQLNNSAQDEIGGHHGTVVGSGTFGGYGDNTCNPGETTACFAGRFGITIYWWIVPTGERGFGRVVPGFSSDSANFWFFSPANWELLVKTVNGCSLNDRHWIFYAPVTDVHHTVEVYDHLTDRLRYFHGYQGASAGETDTDALNTCP